MSTFMKAITSLCRLNEIQLIAKHNQLFASLPMTSRRRLSSTEGQRVNGLPKLPVPPLNDTMNRLKSAVKPFARSNEELEELVTIIDEFSETKGVGHKLNSLLEHKSSQTTNWLSHDWWVNKVYLEGRDPVMIWSNPGLVFPDIQLMKKQNKDFVIQFITRLIISVIDFRNSLKNGINPETGAQESETTVPTVCMDQYSRTFGTCRIPGSPVDGIRFGNLESNDFSIIISRFNKFYKLSLSETNNKEAILPVIQSAIIYILSQSNSEAIPFGIFSSLPRNDFSTVFQLLDENSLNSLIESEFIVNIDHIQDIQDFNREDNESYYKLMAKQSLYADIDNIGNRWFDKTIQLIVALNKSGDQVIGTAFNYEHTPCEGGIVVKMMEHSIKHLVSDKTQLTKGSIINTNIEELFCISGDNHQKLKSCEQFSKQKYLDFIQSIDLEIFQFKDYGKEFIKSVKCSPDSWIQLAIALTYYRLHGKVGATYESGGTRGFAYGRTETIRSVSNDFLNFFKTPNFQTLMNAIDSHKKLVKSAVSGHGIDRILLGLKCTAQEVKEGKWMWGLNQYLIDNPLTESDYQTIEKLYSNDLYLRSKHFHMSTSQVNSVFPQSFMCYGPAVYDGYGCCYNPSKDQIIFAISAFKQNNGNTSALGYKSELQRSLQSLREMASKQSKQSKL